MLRYRLPKPTSGLTSYFPLMLIIVWLLCMIAVPIVRWTLGHQAIYPLVSYSVLLQGVAVFAILASAWGVKRTLGTAAIITLFTLFAEVIGSQTGFPFGPYAYTDRLQPQIGHVPILIPLAWFMMIPSAWAVADKYRHKLWIFGLVSAAALTAWDLLLDPQMVGWDLWRWDNPGLYFGIPLTNFFGWMLVATLLTWLIRPPRVPVAPLLIIYSITWFLEVFGLAFFWGMPGPALVGGLIMGAFLWLGWRNYLRNADRENQW